MSICATQLPEKYIKLLRGLFLCVKSEHIRKFLSEYLQLLVDFHVGDGPGIILTGNFPDQTTEGTFLVLVLALYPVQDSTVMEIEGVNQPVVIFTRKLKM